MQSNENDTLQIAFKFTLGDVAIQINKLQNVLQTLGSRTKSVGILMMGAMNNYEVHMTTIRSIKDTCPNLKEFYAARLVIQSEKFNVETLRPFFGRLEKIVLQFCLFDGMKTYAECKALQEWTQEMGYGFNGKCLHFRFPQLRSINFSKVDDIYNKQMEQFLSNNPQLKSIKLTRCEIHPGIFELIWKHVPNVEEFAFNFRRSLVRRSHMRENLKYLLELKQLKSFSLDCVGVAMGDAMMKIAEQNDSLNSVGLFCCPWEHKLITAFANIKGLTSLHLSNVTGLNDERLKLLSFSLIGLTDVTLKFIENITTDGVIKLITKCQRLTTVNLVMKKMTTISADRYNILIEAIRKRPDQLKLTITFWGWKNPLKLSKDLLERNLEFLEIHTKREELNENSEFDYYCDSADGGYDLVGVIDQLNCLCSCNII